MNFNVENFKSLHNCEPTFSVKGVSQSSNLKAESIAFSLEIDSRLIDSLCAIQSVIIFIPKGSNLPDECHTGNLLIEAVNPRYDYIKTTRAVFDITKTYSGVGGELAYVDPTAQIGCSVELSPFCYVGPNCIVEDHCYLAPGARLIDSVHVGQGTRIGANTVVGGWGFGIERNNGKEREVISFGGEPIKMPHFGGVIIGPNCDIGALTTICAGAIEPTVLESSVMVDDHVHIAHNCKIGKGAAIVACAEISGSVVIGDEAWIAPNVSTMQKISIGQRCIIGIGSVVLESTPANSVFVGNPAKQINK